ncbi:MAG: hypothetical protein RL711_194 [Bacteroidota bacterium]
MLINVKQKNRKKIYLFLSLSVFFLVLNLLPLHLINEEGHHHFEKFEDTLYPINNIGTLMQVIDDSARVNHIKPKSLAYNEIITTIIKRRFRHGYSHYGFQDNWVATLAGYFIWRDLSAIVDPDDLMKYPNAACSQQAIVMMEVLKNKGIPFCKVGWNHHFTLCAWVNNGWHYYDPNMEPIINSNQRAFDNKFLSIPFLAEIYKGRISKNDIAFALGVPQMGKVNEFPAPNALIFHQITKIVSISLWFFMLLPVLYWYRPIHIKTRKMHHTTFMKIKSAYHNKI